MQDDILKRIMDKAPTDPEARRLALALEDIQKVIPLAAKVIVVNEDQWDRALLEPRATFPFLERDGEYWGSPVNDRVAVAELERLGRLGAQHVVFSWQSFWWLTHYPRLQRYLASHGRCLLALYSFPNATSSSCDLSLLGSAVFRSTWA